MKSNIILTKAVHIEHFATPPGFEGWSNFVAFGSDYIYELFGNSEYVEGDDSHFTMDALGMVGLKADVTANYTVGADGSFSYLISNMVLSFEGTVFEEWSNLSWSSAGINAAVSFGHYVDQFDYQFTVPKGTAKHNFLMGTHVNDYVIDERSGPKTTATIFTYGGDDIIDVSSLTGATYIGAGPGDDTIMGGNGADLIGGEDGDDRLFGGAGHDNLGGGDGNDRLFGGDKKDRLDGGAGDDLMRGGDGNDFFEDRAGANTFFGGNGNDNINGSGTLVGGAGNDALSGGGILFGGNGHDSVSGSGILRGGAGDDTVSGRGKLSGGQGDDTIGSNGKPVEGTPDQFFGGGGSDEITVFFRGSVDIWGGSGADVISSFYAKGAIYGGGGNDKMTGTGELFGGAGNDKITARGSSTIEGGGGNDRISGSGGVTVNGGAGDDIIRVYGGSTIKGGLGNDLIEAGHHDIDVFDFRFKGNSGFGNDILLASFDDNDRRVEDVLQFNAGTTFSYNYFEKRQLLVLTATQDGNTVGTIKFRNALGEAEWISEITDAMEFL